MNWVPNGVSVTSLGVPIFPRAQGPPIANLLRSAVCTYFARQVYLIEHKSNKISAMLKLWFHGSSKKQ